MMNGIRLLALVFGLITLLQVHASALTLNVDATGQLMGANGITVDNRLYDVYFWDGWGLNYPGGSNGLTFNTPSLANLASEALWQQVYQGTPFISQPILTYGIEIYIGGVASGASILTPYSFIPESELVFGSTLHLKLGEDTPSVYDEIYNFLYGYPTNELWSEWDSLGTWAVWTPAAVEPIPEPSTMLLFGAGLFGLFVYSRGRRG